MVIKTNYKKDISIQKEIVKQVNLEIEIKKDLEWEDVQNQIDNKINGIAGVISSW